MPKWSWVTPKKGHFFISAAPLKVKLMVNNVHLQLGFLDVL